LTRLGTAQDSTALCTSCHLDTQAYGSFSGPRVYGESAHGNPLSGVTRVPSGVATGDCLNCHDPHGQGYPKLLKGPRSGEFCLAAGCHESGAFGTLWPGKAAYQVAGGVHRQPPALPKPGVRRTYPRRDLPAGFCVNCHNPHGALDPRTGRVTPGLTNAARAELCYQCHTELRFTFARPSHHPVDEPGSDLTCTSCHNPHLVGWSGRVTDPDRPTAVMVNRDEFCLRCHDGSFGLATDLRAKLATGEHPGGSCLGCHEPHGSSRPHLQR
jgi:predicted CXXCH cytochrome family protein